MGRCRGVTNADKRCKRKTNDTFCYHHKDQKKTIITNLPSSRAILPQKCETVIARGPSKTDKKGHIYVYSLLSDNKEYGEYWKIGRTTQGVQKRLSQWPGSILESSYKVKYNKMAERMIHLILDDVRIYRYAYETKNTKQYHSIYKQSGKSVKDTQNRDKDIERDTWKLSALGKHVEWFLCDTKTVRQVIKAVVEYVNKITV